MSWVRTEMALAQPADTDVTVPLSAVLDRLARAGEHDVELPVPPVTVSESWAGIGAPRAGWELLGTVQDTALRTAAEAGIREIAAIIPDKPGALIVNNARATVWGRELPAACRPGPRSPRSPWASWQRANNGSTAPGAGSG